MVTLKRIDPLSLAKIVALLMVIVGLFLGIFYAIILGPYIVNLDPNAAAELEAAGIAGGMFTPWAIIIMPIVYGVMGFLAGLIGAWLYNMFARGIGGVKLDLSK